MQALTPGEQSRYSRQMMIPNWGAEGQLRLKNASVFIVGAGGLGSPVSIGLAVAGVGELHICDADVVELSNLNRQILHKDSRIGMPKALSAHKTLTALNPEIQVVPHEVYLDERNITDIVDQPDLVIDCLDNFDTRYLLNRYCLQRQIPLIHGAVEGLIGQTTFLQPPQTPCLRSIFPDAPPKRPFPIVGVTASIIGSIQAMEALKYLTGMGPALKNRLLIFDGEDMTFLSVHLQRNPHCPECAHLTPTEPADSESN